MFDFKLPDVWEELSKPLPEAGAADAAAAPVISSEAREKLISVLDQCTFEFRGEGRANAVFAIHAPDGQGQDEATTATATATVPSDFFAGTLLRVPKHTPKITPCDYEAMQCFHERLIDVHAGREHIVPQLVVRISASVASALDAQRRGDPAHRDDGSSIAAGYAMLIEDMSETPSLIVGEFKPKWLAQSPLAPADAVRCRNCAREAYRLAQKGADAGHEDDPDVPVCPLGLLHADRRVVLATIDRLVPDWSERQRERLADALARTGILERLRAVQVRGDPPGEDRLHADPENEWFGLAMTLRDCSVFVRMPVDDNDNEDDDGDGARAEEREVTLKLADVDMKNAQEKKTYWQKSHQKLVDGGWYSKPLDTACVLDLDRCLAEGRTEDVPAPFRQRLGLSA
ncbi:inositol-pentakisphosphate 2-kinase-domain-containing protein [Xylariomycetidae sp. FL0641]|nr:inositol-pentakisphosphate 2-kinase-domain-containing protein [Xylariomycetidae sp. FL0641]KAI0024858.1 inositol-pentakisphosphate 2-kinase-domain-containing protein [Xylariomycetidae sp. FL0641]